MKTRSLLVCFMIFSLSSWEAYGECKRILIQPDLALNGSGVWIKKTCHKSTLALGAIKYRDGALFSSFIDRVTGESINPRLQTVNLLKVWNNSFGWGYTDFGLGVGIAHGEKARNCSSQPAFLGTLHRCKVDSISTIGLPINATAVVGKYVGIGFSANIFLSLEGVLGASAGFSIPIGKF
ncbi:hypothetical protein [Teredinibacter waterburyi]|uniref:hypothetical protein n=1 Tax=Teredinibacter waterburyi TaxID=1500538 RepID=UPI00165F1274|nr:hypothetical protein [Teredinibacter waterburyi]